MEPAGELPLLGGAVGRRPRVVRLGPVGNQLERGRPADTVAELVERHVDRDAGEPGLERRLAAVTGEPLERLDERVLDQILEVGRGAGEAADDPLDVTHVVAEKPVERGLIARLAAGDERGIVAARQQSSAGARPAGHVFHVHSPDCAPNAAPG